MKGWPDVEHGVLPDLVSSLRQVQKLLVSRDLNLCGSSLCCCTEHGQILLADVRLEIDLCTFDARSRRPSLGKGQARLHESPTVQRHAQGEAIVRCYARG